MVSPLTDRIIQVIQQIPQGKVATYGQIARLAGNPRAARQVSRILHSSSKKFALPWYRIINSSGTISLIAKDDKELQKTLLQSEGVKVSNTFSISLATYQWKPDDFEFS